MREDCQDFPKNLMQFAVRALVKDSKTEWKEISPIMSPEEISMKKQEDIEENKMKNSVI